MRRAWSASAVFDFSIYLCWQLRGKTAQAYHVYVFMVIEHLTHQLVGRALLRTDVFRRGDDQLHLKTVAEFKQGRDRFRIQTRGFVEEQQAVRGNVFTAHAARL